MPSPLIVQLFLAASVLGGLETSLTDRNASLEVSRVEYSGREAVRAGDRRTGELDPLLLLPVDGFRDGVIEADVAGMPSAQSGDGARGFVGIAFRVQPGRSAYEAIYIRPTNGRAEDQLRRNHSTQYISAPDYPWHRLRKETPGVYESYVDLVPGEWTRLRIEVRGSTARLFVGDAGQPALIVKDLKLGSAASGGVALWVGDGTDAYFNNVRVTAAE